jgi:hypothetical protein
MRKWIAPLALVLSVVAATALVAVREPGTRQGHHRRLVAKSAVAFPRARQDHRRRLPSHPEVTGARPKWSLRLVSHEPEKAETEVQRDVDGQEPVPRGCVNATRKRSRAASAPSATSATRRPPHGDTPLVSTPRGRVRRSPDRPPPEPSPAHPEGPEGRRCDRSGVLRLVSHDAGKGRDAEVQRDVDGQEPVPRRLRQLPQGRGQEGRRQQGADQVRPVPPEGLSRTAIRR